MNSSPYQGWVLWQLASRLKGIPKGSDRLRRHLLRLERAGKLPAGVMQRFSGKIWVNLDALNSLIGFGDQVQVPASEQR